jgi:hypothetical protein
VDGDVEVETRPAADGAAEQPLRAPTLQHGLQRLEQVAVFPAQVDQALACADDPGGQRHALEDLIGMARE